MKFTKSTSKERSTSKWAGGTTTQLAIYPPTAEFTKYNFQFRISTATVEVPESTFTFMPGVKRHFMILDGEVDLDHKGRYHKHLPKFGYDVFDGEWPTTSKGVVTDFNLLLREKTTGKLQAIGLKERGEETIAFRARTSFSGYYVLEGRLRLIAGAHSAELKKGDFLLCEHENEEVILHMQALAYSEVIVSTIEL